jgi:hypothetical protein
MNAKKINHSSSSSSEHYFAVLSFPPLQFASIQLLLLSFITFFCSFSSSPASSHLCFPPLSLSPPPPLSPLPLISYHPSYTQPFRPWVRRSTERRRGLSPDQQRAGEGYLLISSLSTTTKASPGSGNLPLLSIKSL